MNPFTCHPAIEDGLQALEALAGHAAKEAEQRELATRVLACFDRTAAEQHRAEERTVFPGLRAQAAAAGRPEVGGALYELEKEHERMERLYANLRPQIERLRNGMAADLRPEAVAHFAWLYRRHIRLEAQVIEPFFRETAR